jgi:hypothetical protein
LQINRPPDLWFGPVTVLMLEALRPVMDRVAPLSEGARAVFEGNAVRVVQRERAPLVRAGRRVPGLGARSRR